MASPQPIKRLVIDAHLPAVCDAGARLQWLLDSAFCRQAGDLVFDILVGNAPTDKFVKIGETTADFYLDSSQRDLTKLLQIYYAIRTRNVVTGERWYSPPQRIGCQWEHNDWRVAREIIRGWHVRLRKGRAGTKGWLLKRRNIGAVCTECTDVDDPNRILKGNCAACYGTGIVGGYYDPIEKWVDAGAERIMRALEGDQGYQTQVIRSFKAAAYPPLDSNDYWKDSTSGLIYKVQTTIATIAHLRMVPILQETEVDVEERSHVIYTFPIENG